MVYSWFNDKNEVWRPVVGYEGYYEVSSLGNVRSVDRYVEGRNGMLKSTDICKWKNHGNYLQVSLHKDDKKNGYGVQRLAGFAFVPNPLNLPEANHINTIRYDNRSNNINWMTGEDNKKYSIEMGTWCHGERHNKTKLKEPDVIEIRRLHATGEYNYEDLAKMYNINPCNISRIVKRINWKHLK